jgi:hypothetical protein
MDEILSYYSDRSNEFWKVILSEVCKIDNSISDVMLNKKDKNLFTQAFVDFYITYTMDLTFALNASKFLTLSLEHLKDLSLLAKKPNC